MGNESIDVEQTQEAPSPDIFKGNGALSLFDKRHSFTRARDYVKAGYYAYFLPISENRSSEVEIDGQTLIMMGSNNYLGLVQDPRVKEAAIEATRRFGSGCTGSRFLNGTLALHEELEARLANFMHRESALTFSTGYQANQGVISTLVGKNDVLYCDRENHASIFEGCRLSYGQVRKFKHNDMEDLDRLLHLNDRGHGKLIVADGLFSMSGDLINLPKVVGMAKEVGAGVMIDDAHGIGVMGEHGRGTAEHFGLDDGVDLIVGTFSKSFAGLGGFVVGDEDAIHYIKHFARSLIFSASMTPASAAGVIAALDIIEKEPDRREQLWKNFRHMKAGFESLGFNTLDTNTPIIPIHSGKDITTFQFWRGLHDNGVYTNPVIPPAVPPDQCLIRTSLMATHTTEQLDRVLEVFEKVGKDLGIIGN
jgi:8-amino-7-oxononanoate synthase